MTVLSSMILPFFSGVPAGFPSPAADYAEQNIDLNDILIKHPASTFIIQATGDSMIGANIPSGAYLVVDRSVKPTNKSIVVALLDGEFTIKYFRKEINGVTLHPANKNYSPIKITEEMDFRVWGVVTSIIITKPA